MRVLVQRQLRCGGTRRNNLGKNTHFLSAHEAVAGKSGGRFTFPTVGGDFLVLFLVEKI